MLFTTSWDDGYKLDLTLADLLSRYGAKGTFYVCPKTQFKEEMMTEDDIRSLSAAHEIGAHTLNHPKLTKITPEDARKEIAGSKAWIEEITGKPCKMFCYPYGDHNSEIVNIVREEGYAGARTVLPLEFTGKNPYTLPTTLQVYPFPWRRRWKRLSHYFNPLGHDLPYWKKLTAERLPLSAYISWLNLAKALFQYAIQTNQPWFHLWGHSEELDRYGMWGDLDRFLHFVQQYDVTYVTNSKLLEWRDTSPIKGEDKGGGSPSPLKGGGLGRGFIQKQPSL